jgi:hypothetical protein
MGPPRRNSYLMAVNSLAICGRTKETVIFGKKE